MRIQDIKALNPDYIVVGGGSAGCVVAARLSENPKNNVLLLEAGGSSDSPLVKFPAGVAMLVENEKWDWCYETDPDPTLNGRQFTWSAGRCLGGGSAINGQVFIRGLPDDYDEWSKMLGNTGDWSYKDMIQHFISNESYDQATSSDERGAKGPLRVSSLNEPHPLAKQFIQAGVDLGYSECDLNGGIREGFGYTQASQQSGIRCSAYEAYIKPNKNRKNLHVVTGAHTSRVVFSGAKAIGVEFSYGSEPKCTVNCKKEVIVCTGAIASPALLQRSGIGPKEVLARAGIETVVNAAGVGQNLQEHAGIGISKYIHGQSLNTDQLPHRAILAGLKYLFTRSGPLASPVVQAMAYVRTKPELSRPDVQLHFLPFAYVLSPESRSALTAHMPKRAAVMFNSTLCKPKTRGQIRIASSDPYAKPVIDHRLLEADEDVETLVSSCKFIAQLIKSEHITPHIKGDLNPPAEPTDDSDWIEYVRNNANVAYHPVGTCRMGRKEDPLSVVDANLNVIGAQSLRVVDASIMPTVTSANTNAPVMAIAEKAATLILNS